MAIDQPAWGQVRTRKNWRNRAPYSGGRRTVCGRRYDLTIRKKRVRALEAKLAQDGDSCGGAVAAFECVQVET